MSKEYKDRKSGEDPDPLSLDTPLIHGFIVPGAEGVRWRVTDVQNFHTSYHNGFSPTAAFDSRNLFA